MLLEENCFHVTLIIFTYISFQSLASKLVALPKCNKLCFIDAFLGILMCFREMNCYASNALSSLSFELTTVLLTESN